MRQIKSKAIMEIRPFCMSSGVSRTRFGQMNLERIVNLQAIHFSNFIKCPLDFYWVNSFVVNLLSFPVETALRPEII